MTVRREHWVFFGAVLALWLLFFVQAINTPVVLDDWFQLRYWRDHEFGPSALWDYARHNYFHYNPRLGEVLLATIDGSQAIHLILTPLVQLAVLPTVFAIAFARWPRASFRDLRLLLFIQVMIWLVIPIPGIIYFYRPITTNYLWAFTITLALFVPYRLALARESHAPRRWLVPIMFVLGWAAGMCNEHTGPTAMVAMAGCVYAAWRLRRVRAWMVAGMLGLYVGYPMLFFAPGQTVRYGGVAERDTPVKLLADRGVFGCLEIVGTFLYESRLAIALFVAGVVSYLIRLNSRGARFVPPSRRALVAAGVLATASIAIVMTLFVSPTTTDRLFYASGVLLVAAFAIGAEYLFRDHLVRRFVVVACGLVFAFHAVRFVYTYAAYKAENDERIALLAAAAPGSVIVVPTYERVERSRWHFGDDFVQHPGWLTDYVGSELHDLARVDLDRPNRHPPKHQLARFTYETTRRLSFADLPTYRQLQTPAGRFQLAIQIGREQAAGLVRFTSRALGVYDEPKHRPLVVIDWTPDRGYTFVDGRPYDESRGHFIRVRRDTVPPRLETTYITGCGWPNKVELVIDGADADPLIPVDERFCRGPFTAIMCEPDRCFIAGWY
jgi:hypothetical protein